MAFGLAGIAYGKKALRRTLSGLKEAALKPSTVPKGYFAVYVGEDQEKRYVEPMSYLNEPAFQELLSMAEEEYGYEHPMADSQFPVKKTCSLISFLNFEWIVLRLTLSKFDRAILYNVIFHVCKFEKKKEKKETVCPL